MNAAAWRLTLCAAVLMGLVVGGRTAGGLFVSPLNTASGLGLASLSLALALGQLGVGFLQPALGAMADRFGAARIITVGAVLLALSTAAPALLPHAPLVAVALVTATLAGSAVASNGLLLGTLHRTVPPQCAGFAVAVVGVGASAGQLVLGPAVQWGIDAWGWSVALLVSGLLALLALPLARPFRCPGKPLSASAPPSPSHGAGPGAGSGPAWRDGQFWRIAGSFGVCGFHVAFLTAHMPGVIERCGLPASLAGAWLAVSGAANIAGSLAIGFALRRGDAARWLTLVYMVRAVGIAMLLALPISPLFMLAFAAIMGASHMAALPPTSQLLAQRFGTQRLGALFGLLMLVHQGGSFAGVWLGGWAAQATGGDTLLWSVDIALALLAAALAWTLVAVQPSALPRAAAAAMR